MALPTQADLHAETDARFRGNHPNAPERLDPDDPAQAELVRAWLQLRDEIVNDWTDGQFAEHFPRIGRLDPSNPEHQPYVEYWLDIRDQIRDGAPARYDLSAPGVSEPPLPTSSADGNPYRGTAWEAIWDDGYATGVAYPASSVAPPDSLTGPEQEVWQAGFDEGQLAAAHPQEPGVSVPTTTPTTTVSEHENPEYGLPTLKITIPEEDIGVQLVDAGPAIVKITFSLRPGTLSVEPPESAKGLSVDQSGYSMEVQQQVGSLMSGLTISNVTGGLTGDPIAIGGQWGTQWWTNEVQAVPPNKMVYQGQANVNDIAIPTSHGDAKIKGQFGFQVAFELIPKAPPAVPDETAWYEEVWDTVKDVAPVIIVGAVIVGAVVLMPEGTPLWLRMGAAAGI